MGGGIDMKCRMNGEVRKNISGRTRKCFCKSACICVWAEDDLRIGRRKSPNIAMWRNKEKLQESKKDWIAVVIYFSLP